MYKHWQNFVIAFPLAVCWSINACMITKIMILYFDNVNLEVTYPSGDLLIQVSPLILKHIIMNVIFDINVFKLHGTNTYYLNCLLLNWSTMFLQGLFIVRLTFIHRFGCNSDSMFNNIIFKIKIQQFLWFLSKQRQWYNFSALVEQCNITEWITFHWML